MNVAEEKEAKPSLEQLTNQLKDWQALYMFELNAVEARLDVESLCLTPRAD